MNSIRLFWLCFSSRSLWTSPLFIVLYFLILFGVGQSPDPLFALAKSALSLCAMGAIFSLMAVAQFHVMKWASGKYPYPYQK